VGEARVVVVVARERGTARGRAGARKESPRAKARNVPHSLDVCS